MTHKVNEKIAEYNKVVESINKIKNEIYIKYDVAGLATKLHQFALEINTEQVWDASHEINCLYKILAIPTKKIKGEQ